MSQRTGSVSGLVITGENALTVFFRGSHGTEAGGQPKASPGGNIPCNQWVIVGVSASETSVWDAFQLFKHPVLDGSQIKRSGHVSASETLFGLGKPEGSSTSEGLCKAFAGLGVVRGNSEATLGAMGQN